jgi:hypothetical protein
MHREVQGDRVMACKVWNENLAAFVVVEPLPTMPEPTIETPATCERESDGSHER